MGKLDERTPISIILMQGSVNARLARSCRRF